MSSSDSIAEAKTKVFEAWFKDQPEDFRQSISNQRSRLAWYEIEPSQRPRPQEWFHVDPVWPEDVPGRDRVVRFEEGARVPAKVKAVPGVNLATALNLEDVEAQVNLEADRVLKVDLFESLVVLVVLEFLGALTLAGGISIVLEIPFVRMLWVLTLVSWGSLFCVAGVMIVLLVVPSRLHQRWATDSQASLTFRTLRTSQNRGYGTFSSTSSEPAYQPQWQMGSSTSSSARTGMRS